MEAGKRLGVKARGVLFKGELVRAIIEGRKRVTRRLINPQPLWCHAIRPAWGTSPDGFEFGEKWLWRECGPDYPDGPEDERRCPQGKPGDRLYVKETWRPRIAHSHGQSACDCADVTIRYAADGAERFFAANEIPDSWTMPRAASTGGGVSPLFMPSWASRLWLEIVDVRAERLQEITEEDAYAEGVAGLLPEDNAASARHEFEILWDRIHPRRASWASNPWVWVIRFSKVEP